jgi:tetratricopeptide (TPR) repeat protein
MAAGYIYVLVNSSMAGLVKVGRTTRLPSERVVELSAPTGVPTPFVVAFEQFFSNCDLAEGFIHAELERRGLRQAKNREFFRAPANDVIRVILQAPGLVDWDEEETWASDQHDLISIDAPKDELPRRSIKHWEEIIDKANDYYNGKGRKIQDYDEALVLYKQAAKLGSSYACEQIGYMHQRGRGVKKNRRLALNYYKEGVKRGNYYCLTLMADIFEMDHEIDNVVKLWKEFFETRRKGVNSDVEFDHGSSYFMQTCADYIQTCFVNDLEIGFKDDMIPVAQDLYQKLKEDFDKQSMRSSRKSHYYEAVRWARTNLPVDAPDDVNGAVVIAGKALNWLIKILGA